MTSIKKKTLISFRLILTRSERSMKIERVEKKRKVIIARKNHTNKFFHWKRKTLIIPVTRSTDLLEGPQNRTILFFPPLEQISLLIEQKILIRTTPVKVFPVPVKIKYYRK